MDLRLKPADADVPATTLQGPQTSGWQEQDWAGSQNWRGWGARSSDWQPDARGSDWWSARGSDWRSWWGDWQPDADDEDHLTGIVEFMATDAAEAAAATLPAVPPLEADPPATLEAGPPTPPADPPATLLAGPPTPPADSPATCANKLIRLILEKLVLRHNLRVTPPAEPPTSILHLPTTIIKLRKLVLKPTPTLPSASLVPCLPPAPVSNWPVQVPPPPSTAKDPITPVPPKIPRLDLTILDNPQDGPFDPEGMGLLEC